MSKIITQKAEENKQISERIKNFMKRFDVSSALKSSNAVKIKGFAVIEIFQYLFMLVFAHRSIYMDMKKDTVPFAKDTVYRFLNSARINWLKFTTRLSSKIIEDAIDPLTSELRENVLIIDDSGNRITEESVEKGITTTKAYTYGDGNLLLGYTVTTGTEETDEVKYEYDKNGNLIKEFDIIKNGKVYSDAEKLNTQNTYNALNQLVSSETSEFTITNEYNAEGLRTGKEVKSKGVDLTQKNNYTYEYDQVIFETSEPDNYIWNVQGINLISRQINGEMFWCMYNGHADITRLVDENSDLAEKYYYDEWGVETESLRYGDITGDGEENINDYTLLKRHLFFNSSELTAEQQIVSDLNGDGKTDADDLNILKQIVLKTVKYVKNATENVRGQYQTALAIGKTDAFSPVVNISANYSQGVYDILGDQIEGFTQFYDNPVQNAGSSVNYFLSDPLKNNPIYGVYQYGKDLKNAVSTNDWDTASYKLGVGAVNTAEVAASIAIGGKIPTGKVSVPKVSTLSKIRNAIDNFGTPALAGANGMVISGAVPIEASISSATVASASGVVAGAAVGQNVVYSSNFNNTSSGASQKNTSGGRNDISDTSENLGIVKSRINIAKGATRFTPLRPRSNNPVSAGFEHVTQGHFNRPLDNNRSVFSVSEEKLKSIYKERILLIRLLHLLRVDSMLEQ